MPRRELHHLIRTIPDFPSPGIQFKDITPVLADRFAFRQAIDELAERVPPDEYDLIAAPEARGFIFGCALAAVVGRGFVPIRKPGKLPFETATVTYDLEYGSDTVEMHVDAVATGERVLLVDDVLATGGTMEACAQLIESRGGIVHRLLFFLELRTLEGRRRLKDHQVVSLIED